MSKTFTDKSIKTHGNKYDYSLVEYINNKTKVKIICPIHGVFQQRPNDHLMGNGCSKCSGKYKYSVDEFINKAMVIHHNKYDYSLAEYVNNKTDVKIICPIHGVFQQSPDKHINSKYGCIKCGKKQPLSISEFIVKATIIHGDKYSYSNSVYVDAKTKIDIICPTHGTFQQRPNEHLRSKGCAKCSRPNIIDFINKANMVHGNKYSYLNSVYVDAKTKVDITCPIHGVFKQKINDHLYGNGCPICRESLGEKRIGVLLDNWGIKFKRQYRFSDCKFKYSLPFDFYIPETNTCLEYNGIQHYIELKYFHRNEGDFKIQQIKDKIKSDYCLSNNINLIIIKYYENIDTVLGDFLKQHKK